MSVTPAMGASTVAGRTSTAPIVTLDGNMCRMDVFTILVCWNGAGGLAVISNSKEITEMKAVQAAVLLVAGALGAVLFMNWKGRTPEAPPPVEQPATPALPPEPAPVAAPEPPKPVVKPRPVRRKPAEPVVASNHPPAPVSQAPAPVTPSTPPVEAVRPADPPPPPPPPPLRKVTMPSGTLIPVRIIETLSSDRNKPGDTFTASLDQDLVVDGFVIADRGARADGKIVETQAAGRVKGLSSLAVELTQIVTSDGQRIDIQTDSFTKAGQSSKGTDAAKVGGAAAIGAAIGAIAGGGKGAGIGAIIGGSAGTGTVLATRGKAAVLSSETQISFRLRDSVTITEKRRKN